MTIECTAIYENGILRPLQAPGLAEGERVELIIVARRPEQAKPADVLAAIAALPVEGSGNAHTSRDHDQVLYGADGAR